MTCAQSLAEFERIMVLVAGSCVRVNGSLSTAFGCPFDGEQSLDRVLWGAERYVALGMDGVTLADTIGMACPTQVATTVAAVRALFPTIEWTAHFHDTRGMGLANVMAAVAAGIDHFDTSLGGIGGCPYAPGATGNIGTGGHGPHAGRLRLRDRRPISTR